MGESMTCIPGVSDIVFSKWFCAEDVESKSIILRAWEAGEGTGTSVDFHGGGHITLDSSEGTQSVATVDVPGGEGTITLGGAFEVPDVSEVSMTMWLQPPSSAAYAAGYSCWTALVIKTVGVYPTDLASE